jgi:tRNA(fMet)-specific endonuclease VapC
LTILPIQIAISNLSIELIEKYVLSHKLALPDALIGATALFHNIELYTLNLKDFRFLENIKLFEVN